MDRPTGRDITACTIYVEGFPLDTSEDFIRDKFSSFGPIICVSLQHFPESHPINRDRTCPLSKGYAFVEFELSDDAMAAFKYYNTLANLKASNFFPRVMMRSTWLDYLKRYNVLQKSGYRECKQTICISDHGGDYESLAALQRRD